MPVFRGGRRRGDPRSRRALLLVPFLLAGCASAAPATPTPGPSRVPATAPTSAATKLDVARIAELLAKNEVACTQTDELAVTYPGSLMLPTDALPKPPNVLLDRRWMPVCEFTSTDSYAKVDAEEMHQRWWQALITYLSASTQVQSRMSGPLFIPDDPAIYPRLDEYGYTSGSVLGHLTVWTMPPSDVGATAGTGRPQFLVPIQLIEVAAAD